MKTWIKKAPKGKTSPTMKPLRRLGNRLTLFQMKRKNRKLKLVNRSNEKKRNEFAYFERLRIIEKHKEST